MQTARVFESIGLDAEEEDLYLRLLATGSTSVAALASELHWASSRVRSVLKRLESKGFVTRSLSPAKDFLAVAPDAAVEHLAVRREEEIAGARATASQLAADFRAKLQRSDPGELVEVVVGVEATIERLAQLELTARSEIVVLSKPPYINPQENSNPRELELLARGVRVRVLCEPASLELHTPERIQQDMKAGEQIRVLPDLPMKLLVIDDRIAVTPVATVNMTPVATVNMERERASLVHHAVSVVSGFKLLFELLWERAVPIGVSALDAPATESIGADAADRELVRLLAAGFKDEAIAKQMNLDPRTVRRRLRRLMNVLGAETRFQTGMQVVRHGLIEK